MVAFGEKRPFLFEVLLIIAAFLAAGLLTGAGAVVNMGSDLSSSAGRIIVGAALLVIYRKALRGGKAFSNMVIALPALLFAAWNLFYNLGSGAQIGGTALLAEGLATSLAPAIFEETIFRGIFTHNLKKTGHSDMKCLFITAAFFAAIHLTNLVGQDVLTVALQVVYSFVIGMVLEAIYLRNGSLAQVMAVHFLIDFTNRIYINAPTDASWVQLGIISALLAAEAAYAVWLVSKRKEEKAEY